MRFSAFLNSVQLTFWSICVLSAGMISLLTVDSAHSREVAEQPTKEADAQENREPLPEAFSRSVPTSVEDLKAIQTHVVQLVPQLTECTVNLRIGRAQGSGVIVSADGLILSAAHVTGPPGKPVLIVTSDGKEYEGRTLGRNTTLDGSMVRIESSRKDWPHRRLSEESIRPGDWCLTLGHPGGYQRDRGLVLRLGRVIEENDWLIQTDCELVGGDSGGPLFNMRGDVIGINTRIGESTKYNFHVPQSAFSRDWSRMLAGEDFKSHSGAYLGIGGRPADSGEGLLIQVVEPGTPAERDGLKQGDVLLSFQNVPVADIDQLIGLVGEEPPGRSVSIRISRNGEEKELSVRLGMRWSRVK
ncbi:S1C family serine protease [Planctomicrobium sp. SH661]|uniref:S1C family serine protease n=1 Tax=Planctomicrobium sp. SH661 TaxID=3448124 RepID=UPI003F5BFD08